MTPVQIVRNFIGFNNHRVLNFHFSQMIDLQEKIAKLFSNKFSAFLTCSQLPNAWKCSTQNRAADQLTISKSNVSHSGFMFHVSDPKGLSLSVAACKDGEKETYLISNRLDHPTGIVTTHEMWSFEEGNATNPNEAGRVSDRKLVVSEGLSSPNFTFCISSPPPLPSKWSVETIQTILYMLSSTVFFMSLPGDSMFLM